MLCGVGIICHALPNGYKSSKNINQQNSAIKKPAPAGFFMAIKAEFTAL